MRRGFGFVLGLSVLLWAGGAAAAEEKYFDEITEIKDQSIGGGAFETYRLELDGTDGTGVAVSTFIRVDAGAPLFTTPQQIDGWRRTMNKCRQAAMRVFLKPNKFDLRVEIQGGQLGGILVDGLVGGTDPWESVACTLLRDPTRE